MLKIARFCRVCVMALLVSLLIFGCGGGGGSDSASTAAPNVEDDIGGFSALATIDVEYTSGQYFALKEDGTIWTWGVDFLTYGVSEEALKKPNTYPIMFEFFEKVQAFSVGGRHLLALDDDGTVLTIGNNYYGQLGSGTNDDANTPVSVSGLANVIAVAAGDEFSLALTADGTVWAWGENDYGQLGALDFEDSNIPVQVSGLSNVKAIAAGHNTGFAVLENGDVWHWGQSAGIEPAKIDGLSNIHSVHAELHAFHYVAVSEQGEVWGWGDNIYGQLGVDAPAEIEDPIRFSGIQGAVTAAVSEDNTYVVTDNGTVWGWGLYLYGQLGQPIDNQLDTSTPVQLATEGEAAFVEAHSSAVLIGQADGSLYAIGSNPMGGFADGGQIYQDALSPMTALPVISDLSGFDDTYIALDEGGYVYSWGANNRRGILGNGGYFSSSTPIRLTELNDIVQISMADDTGFALKADGTVWGWGNNAFSKLGVSSEEMSKSFVPVQVPGLSNITQIVAGELFSLALDANGIVWGWGLNRNGSLGLGASSSITTPVALPGFDDTASIALGVEYSLAIKNDGTVWGLGTNSDGQLCTGTTDHALIATQVPGITNAIAADGSDKQTFIVLDDGSVLGCGDNSNGALGDGSLVSTASAVQVPNLENILKVHTEAGNSYAVQSDGTFWSWEEGDYDESGIVPTPYADFRGMTSAVSSRWTAVTLDSEGQVWGMGLNYAGQLANNRLILSTTPILIDENPVE